MTARRNPELRGRSNLKPRKENTREIRGYESSSPYIVLTFRHFDSSQIPPGQTYETWEKDGLLAGALKRLEALSAMSVQEAIKNKCLGVYGKFPENSAFNPPKGVPEGAQWAVIKGVKGQQHRICGYMIANVFHVVFLDANHQFYITEKKHT